MPDALNLPNKPDFYMTFTDSRNPPDPVGCWIQKKCAYKKRECISLVKLDRTIRLYYKNPFHYGEYEYFFLAPKQEDKSPLNILKWPIDVYLLKLNKDPDLYGDKIQDEDLRIEL